MVTSSISLLQVSEFFRHCHSNSIHFYLYSISAYQLLYISRQFHWVSFKFQSIMSNSTSFPPNSIRVRKKWARIDYFWTLNLSLKDFCPIKIGLAWFKGRILAQVSPISAEPNLAFNKLVEVRQPAREWEVIHYYKKSRIQVVVGSKTNIFLYF